MARDQARDRGVVAPDEIYILEDVQELDLDEPEVALEVTRSPEPVQERRSGLASRVARPRTAHQVLDDARREEEAKRRAAENERVRAAQLVAEQQRQRRAEAERDAQEEREAADLAALERATFAPRPVGGSQDLAVRDADVTTLLEGLMGGIEVLDVYLEIPTAILGPLWRAHGVRARHDRDLATALATERVSDVLLEKPTRVAAARVAFGDRDWAVWCDLDTEEVLAVLAPAELYLVGLS